MRPVKMTFSCDSNSDEVHASFTFEQMEAAVTPDGILTITFETAGHFSFFFEFVANIVEAPDNTPEIKHAGIEGDEL